MQFIFSIDGKLLGWPRIHMCSLCYQNIAGYCLNRTFYWCILFKIPSHTPYMSLSFMKNAGLDRVAKQPLQYTTFFWHEFCGGCFGNLHKVAIIAKLNPIWIHLCCSKDGRLLPVQSICILFVTPCRTHYMWLISEECQSWTS